LLPDGAVARQGQHTVFFAPNINTAGAIDLTSPEGKHIRSHVMGIGYFDSATGEMAVVGEIKDSIGQLVAANQIVYPDAFTGIKADIRYTYTVAGFEQEIILQEAPASPLLYGQNGLNPATTKLEIYTEFLDPPQPGLEQRILEQADPQVRNQMVEPDFLDFFITFGPMSIGNGTGFTLPQNPDAPDDIPVGKLWQKRDQRDFLIERVTYSSIEPKLQALQGAALVDPKKNAGMAKRASKRDPF